MIFGSSPNRSADRFRPSHPGLRNRETTMQFLFSTRIRRCPLTTILALAVTAGCGALAHAGDRLRSELGELAEELAPGIKARNESSVSIERLRGPSNLPTSSGPGIAQLLAGEFKRRGIDIDPQAKLSLKGEYLVSEVQPDPDSPRRLLAVRLKGAVEDQDGNILPGLDFDRRIRDEEAFVEVMATSVSLDPADSEDARDMRIRESLVECTAVIQESRVFDEKRDYGLEVLVDDLPREVRAAGALDLPFVSIERGERYHVRLINNTEREAAVRLLIDGLSIYQFSYETNSSGPRRGEPKYSYVIMPPKASVIIKGWHRTNQESDEFQVTAYAEGAVAEVAEALRDEEKLGTINALFMAAWPEDQPPPPDEDSIKGEPNVTGFGPRIEAKYTMISKRRIGRLRSSVSLRYARHDADRGDGFESARAISAGLPFNVGR